MADDATTVFQAIIQAVDKVSAPVRGIMEVVKALVGEEEKAGTTEAKLHKKGEQEAHAHARSFHALSADVRLLRGHFGNLTASIGEFGSKFSELIPAFAGLGAAGSLVGLFEMTNHAAEAFSALAATAKQAGVSVQTFSALSLAAKENDVPVEQLRSSLFNLSKIMGGALAGSNKKAAELFHHLGIALKDSHGQALSASQVLPQLADAFEHTKSATMRALMAQTLFGGRAGAMLLPILMKGKAGLEAYSAAYAKIGYVPTGPAAEQLEAFHSSWVQLTTAVDGFTMEIGTKLAPILRPIIDLSTRWVAANREWITSGIQDAVAGLAGWIGKLNMHQVVAETESWIGTIRSAVSALGGIKVVVGALALAMGSPLLGAVGSAIEIFGALRKVMIGITVAMAANPIILAGVAIAAVAYEIYSHWAKIKPPLLRFWADIKAGWTIEVAQIKGVVDAVWARIAPIIARIRGAVHWVQTSWLGRAETAIVHKIAGAGSGAAPDLSGGLAAAQLRGAPGAPGMPGRPGRGPLAPGPYQTGRAGASRGAAPATVHGRVETTVTFKNAPPGMRATSTAQGAAAAPRVNVGYAAPAFGF
ncbi:MAG: phage tail tape measure protein [Proteobacteria bacterium]|nr:phage tail tape measure protein [Pseudomonadota bacterium]